METEQDNQEPEDIETDAEAAAEEADAPENLDAADEDASDEEEDEEAKGDRELGARAQKRIAQLVAQRKEATAKFEAASKELEEARRLAGDDGKAFLSAAEQSGILPSLMTKAEAKAFDDMARYARVIARYEDWLDGHEDGDEFETGDGHAMSYRKVERRVGRLRGELEELKGDYGPRRRELAKKVRDIFELGQAAMKAGWKPGAKAKAERKPLHDKPFGRKPVAKAGGGTKANWGEVRGERDFLRMIAEENEGARD